MFTLSDILERYQSRLALKSITGYLARSVERTSELVADLHQGAQEQKKNPGGKQEPRDRSVVETADEPAELQFPDRRRQNMPVLLDTRSKRSHARTEQRPFVDITI